MNYQQLWEQVDRQRQWEAERGKAPANDQREPADSIRRLLARDDQEAGDLNKP